MGLGAVPSDPRPRRFFFGGRFVPQPSTAHASGTRGKSLGDLLDASARSPLQRAYLEAVALSDEGTDSDQVDLGEWQRFSRQYESREGGEMSAFRFPVSSSEACERMAATVRGDVCLNAEVVGVREGALRFADGQREEFDEVVLTLPPPCLEGLDIDVDPVWRGVEMTPTAKVALLFERPFWESPNWGGHMMSDLAVQQVWAQGRALVCYVNGRGATALMEREDPVRTALESLERALPDAGRHFVEGRAVAWSDEGFSRGGFPFVPVGARRRAVSSAGPVRFAGDWTAEWTGFVEGALESAERVVGEIKNEHGLS
jgi:monoamine oxidase